MSTCIPFFGTSGVCVCRMGWASAVTSWLAEPPSGTVGGGGRGALCGSQVWGERCVNQDLLGDDAAVTTPKSQWLKTIEVISCSCCIYQMQVIWGLCVSCTLTQVCRADSISQVAGCCSRGTKSPRSARSSMAAISLRWLFTFK